MKFALLDGESFFLETFLLRLPNAGENVPKIALPCRLWKCRARFFKVAPAYFFRYLIAATFSDLARPVCKKREMRGITSLSGFFLRSCTCLFHFAKKKSHPLQSLSPPYTSCPSSSSDLQRGNL